MVTKRILLLSVLFVVALVSSTGPVQAMMYDMTAKGSYWTINGALFTTNNKSSTGTGVIDTFVQIQAKDIEEGYNTDAAPVYNTGSSPQHNRSLLVSGVPVVPIGGVDYLEFLLDINENADPLISLDVLEVYLATVAPGNNALTGPPSGLGTLVYSMGNDGAGAPNWVLSDYRLNSGSGSGDIFVYIPESVFGSGDHYVYLYSKFGASDDSAYPANAGFEEWAVQKQGSPRVPVPAGVILGVLGLSAAGWKLRRFA